MSLTTFFIATLAVIVIAILVRIFWVELLLIWLFLQIIFYISILSTVSAIGWMVFVEDYRSGPTDGLGLTWIFFFIMYSAMVVVWFFIVFDIYKYFRGHIRELLKKR